MGDDDTVALRPLLERFRESVALVAQPADKQIEWMWSHTAVRDGVTVAFPLSSDEIFCELDDARFLTQLNAEPSGLWPTEVNDAVQAIYTEFESWTDRTLWESDEAMSRPEWSRAREVALRALEILKRYWDEPRRGDDGIEPA